MQLRIQRSQRSRGVLGNTIFFCLDVRGDYSPDEQSDIRKYRLGNEVVYSSRAARRHFANASAHLERTQVGDVKERATGLARGAFSMVMAKMSLNISIASLGRGHHIECKDLEELLEAEDTVRVACKNVTRFLEVAATFDGSEVVIDYENGEEKVRIAHAAVPLLEYAPSGSAAAGTAEASALTLSGPVLDLGKEFRKLFDFCVRRWLNLEHRLIDFAGSRGWSVTRPQVRAVFGAVGVLLVIVVLRIA